MKHYLVANDAGKDTQKLIGIELTKNVDFNNYKKVSFPTRYSIIKEEFIEPEGNTYAVNFEGEEYLIGQQGEYKSPTSDKMKLIHKLSTYTAITQLLEPDTKDNQIHMVLACPIGMLSDKETKEEYKAFIQGNDIVKITVDDKNYEFEIVDVMIKAEGSGVMFMAPELFVNKRTAIIDIGGMNLGFTSMINKVCKGRENDRFSNEYGNEKLEKSVESALSRARGGVYIDEDTVTLALHEGRTKSGDKKEIEIISREKDKYFKDILYALLKGKVSIQDFDHIVFIGGTSQHITNQIKSLNNAFTVENPQWVAIEGLYKLSMKKYGAILK